MSVIDELKRGQYEVILVKKLPQRPEHVASAIRRHPKMYPYVFVTIHKFEKIPEHFWTIYFAILRKGAIDGTVYGNYSLTLHGRGKKYGNPPKEARYRKGCSFYFTSQGIKVYDVGFGHSAFRMLLNSIAEVNAYLQGGRKNG